MSRAGELSRIYMSSIKKYSNEKGEAPKVNLFAENDGTLSVTSDSAKRLASHIYSMLTDIESELNEIDKFTANLGDKIDESDLRIDPRVTNLYSDLSDAHENLYNTWMFLNHISDGTSG